MKKKYLKYTIIGIVVIFVDLATYLFLGLMLMNYDDFYDESEGEYWSFESMTTSEILNCIALDIWNLLNFMAIGYLIFRIYKYKKTKRV